MSQSEFVDGSVVGSKAIGTLEAESSKLESESSRCQLDIQCWYRKIYALCQAKLISRVDAEDATQETFSRALPRLDEVRNPSALGGWLRAIAQHVCVDLIRRNCRRKTEPIDLFPVVASSESSEEREQLAALIAELPDDLREALLLYYYQDMSYDEMAAWLGVARSTVNDRLSRARQQLKRRLLTSEGAT
ncbi:MAG: RNA polymerase sigma factor [Planctomycetota bacterium]